MCFLLYFQEHNQTLKNIPKYFLKCHQTPENILHLENILYWTKRSLIKGKFRLTSEGECYSYGSVIKLTIS